ncbi:peptidoglycan D,D-transpeptidase FtsI family protein [Parasphingorhabdus pacifica]
MAQRKTRGVRGKRRTARTDVAGSQRRLAVGRILLVVALVLTGGKLIQLQGFQASALSEKSLQQRVTNEAIPAERGSIIDRSGNVLAFSSEARQLYANPRSLGENQDEEHRKDPSEPTGAEYKREIAAHIHRVLGARLSEEEVLNKLTSGRGFTYFGPLIDPGKARSITEEYPEIGAEYRATREYPAGAVGAHLVGAANWRSNEDVDEQKVRGLFGLEATLDEVLIGEDGARVSDTAMGSDLVIPGTERELKPATPGSDVELTIDSDLQYKLQQKLTDYVARAGAKGGSAVVLDAKTGGVYGLANDRTFDPGNSETWTTENLSNRAVTTPFEPGSVNKVITAAGAIEDGIVRPETVLQVPGKIEVADRVIRDAWPHGTVPLTFTGVLAKSSNVGTLMTAQKMGKDRFAELTAKFGLGQRTGIELGGESAGVVPARESWSGSTFANLPIGQGLSMTVLQMAGMYQAIANDGVRVPPRVVAAEIGPEGKRTPTPRPEGVRVVSSDTAKTVRNMLRAVVQDAPGQTGTGEDAALEGYQVAGKTGTAQQVDPDCGCYSNEKHWITFAGILPAGDPRFVVGIMLDAPSGGTPESSSAAPLFHEIASYLTQRYQIRLSDKPAPEQVLKVR